MLFHFWAWIGSLRNCIVEFNFNYHSEATKQCVHTKHSNGPSFLHIFKLQEGEIVVPFGKPNYSNLVFSLLWIANWNTPFRWNLLKDKNRAHQDKWTHSFKWNWCHYYVFQLIWIVAINDFDRHCLSFMVYILIYTLCLLCLHLYGKWRWWWWWWWWWWWQ